MPLNEQETRFTWIDPSLTQAGWNLKDLTQVRREIPVDGYDKEPWNGVTDYALYDPSGSVLAVVEAKRFSRSPRDADEQLRRYVTEIEKHQAFRPFGFMSNGHKIYFWDVGVANPRLVANFFSPEDLARLLFLRQNQKSLSTELINRSIVDRPYQHEAIRRVAEVFTNGKRRALLVMATGTGKTRVTMGLIDLFLRTNQARKVLFMADRDALVDQALTSGFKAHLPNEPRDRIYTHKIDKDKRLFVATLQTMGRCFSQFSPGFFDLIIFDEAHRSIFNRFTEVIEYFDARMIGLTATPANFIDRDTFRTFYCEGTVPTFLYPYEDAVKEKYLVDFVLHQAQTGFQRKGIKGAELSEEEKNGLLEQGIDPDDLNYDGTDIEIMVSNKDTLRRQWEEIIENCLKDQSGQLPGKTIVFAMTKKHAQRVCEVFEEMYPQHVGLIETIYHGKEHVRDKPNSYGAGLISKFKQNNFPRIAISVDMLDTGIDVPEVVNLVFMKPVHSIIKLWQMIGRGTRNNDTCKYHDRLPNGEKTEFKIIDFWQNDFNKKSEDRPPGEIPVLVSVFNTRLRLLESQLRQTDSFVFQQAKADLRAMMSRIPQESFPVRKVWPEIEEAWGDEFWAFMTAAKIDFLRIQVGPLLRYAAGVDVAAETFTNKVERLKSQQLANRPSQALMQAIAEDASRLPEYIHEDQSKKDSIAICLSDKLPNATPEQLTKVIQDLAALMKDRRERPNTFRNLDLPDFIAMSGMISIGEGGRQIYVEEYRKNVESRIMKIVEDHPVLEAIREGREVTEADLVQLERTLHTELGSGDLPVSTDTIRKAYGLRVDNFLAFLRVVLDMEAIPDYPTVVESAFTKYITSNHYNADQIRFLRSVQEVFLQKRRFEAADLYEAPLTNFGRNAADRFFTPDQIQQILSLTNQLAA